MKKKKERKKKIKKPTVGTVLKLKRKLVELLTFLHNK